jgi:hypothetical protein
LKTSTFEKACRNLAIPPEKRIAKVIYADGIQNSDGTWLMPPFAPPRAVAALLKSHAKLPGHIAYKKKKEILAEYELFYKYNVPASELAYFPNP